MCVNHHGLNIFDHIPHVFATCSKDLVESDHWPPVRVSMELDLSDNEISAPWIKNVLYVVVSTQVLLYVQNST